MGLMVDTLSAPRPRARQALVTVEELAQWLAVSTKWIYRKVASGAIRRSRRSAKKAAVFIAASLI